MINRFLLVCALGVLSVNGADESTTPAASASCPRPTGHYTELGCTPIYNKDKPTCPERYECPFQTATRHSNKCYYKDKVFNLRDKADKEVTNPCLASCFCGEGFEGRASLVCANVECPELFGPRDPAKSHCVNQYKPDDCCSSNEICDADELKKLKTCTWDGKTYKEGERFYPDNYCKTCTCTSDFDGTVEGNWCRDIDCSTEIFHSDSLSNKCAPVYFENRECCPIEWKCEEGSDKVVRSAVTKTKNPLLQCQYGGKMLDVGDSVVTDDKCVTCSCEVPPLISCTRAKNC